MSSTQDQLPKQPSSSADEVEALARALSEFWGDHSVHVSDFPTIARAAIAHMRKRPEGLPTAEEIGRVSYRSQSPGSPDWDWSVTGNAILTALDPYLRDPVGWELDVTWQEVQSAYYRHQSGSPEGQCWHQVIELLRSRIRPVYECQECAGIKNAALAFVENTESIVRSARAALEGE